MHFIVVLIIILKVKENIVLLKKIKMIIMIIKKLKPKKIMMLIML